MVWGGMGGVREDFEEGRFNPDLIYLGILGVRGHAAQGWGWEIWTASFFAAGEVSSQRVGCVFRAHLTVLEVVTGFVAPSVSLPLSHGLIPCLCLSSVPPGRPSGGGGVAKQPDVQVHHPRGPAADDREQQRAAGGDGLLRVGPQELVSVLQGVRRR